jgi:ribose transport system permease protein
MAGAAPSLGWNLRQRYQLDAIGAVILGGTSFVGGVGTLFGALIIAALNNSLTLMNISFFWPLVVKGLVMIVAVTVGKLRTRRVA